MKIRFKASLLHLIHNLQIVGFEFIESQEIGDTFSIILKMKLNDNLRDSLIHASQCLDTLACGIYNDEFTRDKLKIAKVVIVNGNQLASASIPIEIALQKAYEKISLDEYLKQMQFSISK